MFACSGYWALDNKDIISGELLQGRNIEDKEVFVPEIWTEVIEKGKSRGTGYFGGLIFHFPMWKCTLNLIFCSS